MQKYKITKTIGDGSFGTVFKAINVQQNQIVAIKKMKQKYHNWDECIQLREVKSLRKLQHPNLIRLHEVLRINDELYLVFDFLEYNLFQVYNNAREKGRRFTENEIKNIVYQIALGLGHLHKNGFFHRDLKPENILFDNNTVKLCDFGLAREIRSRPPFTDYVSTRWYRAPELLMRSPAYNSPVDIFALGLIMVELYLLSPLLPGVNEIDQMNKTVNLLGTPSKMDWPEGYKLASALNYKFPECKRTELFDIIPDASAEAIDLMESMLQYSSRKRPSAADILKHPFFEKINVSNQEPEKKPAVKFEQCSQNQSILIMPQSIKVENPKQIEMRKTKLKFGGGPENSTKHFETNISKKFDEIQELLQQLTKTKDMEKNTTQRQPEKQPQRAVFAQPKFPQIYKNKRQDTKQPEQNFKLPYFNPSKSISKIPAPIKLSFERPSKDYLLANRY